MIANEQDRGLKSVSCQCGMKAALLERAPPYSPQHQSGPPSGTQGSLYKLLDIQFVDQRDSLAAEQSKLPRRTYLDPQQAASDCPCDTREHSLGSLQVKSTGDGTLASEGRGTDGQGRHETMSNDSYEEFQLGDLKEAVITKMLNHRNGGFNWMAKNGVQQMDSQQRCGKGNSDGQPAQEMQNASTQVNILHGSDADNK